MRLLLLSLLAVPVAAQAGILNANATSNNGTGGVFMDLTPVSQNLAVTQFETMFGSVAGSAVTVEVWTRTGTYVGFSTSNVGWTLFDTVNGVSNGTATLASLVLNNQIQLTGGQTTGVYLHGTTAGGGLRYFGTGTTSVTDFNDGTLALFSAHSRTGAVAFGGTQFTPRALTGNVHYEAVPEPASLAALGLGAMALLRRRRKAAK